MALRPIIEVCARDKGYAGGRRYRDAWWLQVQATLIDMEFDKTVNNMIDNVVVSTSAPKEHIV